MTSPISDQLALFFRAIALGVALGLVYDLFRVLRELGGQLWGGALDAAYCLGAAASLFLFFMAGSGEMRIFVVLGAAGGALLFLCLCGPLLRPVWRFWLGLALLPLRAARKFFKKMGRIAKKLFSFGRIRVTIVKNRLCGVFPRRGRREKNDPNNPVRKARRKKGRRPPPAEAGQPADHPGAGGAADGSGRTDLPHDRTDP